MTTFASFVSSVGSIETPGVMRRYDHEPESLGEGDLPAQFPRLPDGSIGYAPADCPEIEETRAIELVFCIRPVGLGTAAENFAETIEMLDYANAALRTWKFATAQNGMAITYELSTAGSAPVIVGDTAYWAVIATITARG